MSHMPVAREEPYSRLATDRLGSRTVICEAVVRNDGMPLLAAASQCARSPIQSVGRSVPSLRSSVLKMDGTLHAVEATAPSV